MIDNLKRTHVLPFDDLARHCGSSSLYRALLLAVVHHLLHIVASFIQGSSILLTQKVVPLAFKLHTELPVALLDLRTDLVDLGFEGERRLSLISGGLP